jgi:putative transcriptional regulator
MPIIVNLDMQLVKRKMRLTDLAERVGITIANLSILKQGKAKAIRFSTLEAICRELGCQPGDILEYRASSDDMPGSFDRHSPPRDDPDRIA